LMRRARTSGRSLNLASRIAPLARLCQYSAAFHISTARRIPSRSLGVLPCVALRVVAYKNRLTERDAVGDCVNGVLCAVSVLSASGAEVFQSVGLHLGPLNQSSVFVADLTGQLDAKVFTARCPHRGNKKVLFGCPFEPCGLHALIGCGVETAGSIEAELVVSGLYVAVIARVI